MTRLLVHVEGETEETFVNTVLEPYLIGKGFERVDARKLGSSPSRHRRGGAKPWPGVRDDILRRLKGDPGSIATTIVDFYALPAGGPGGWPRRDAVGALEVHEQGRVIADAMEAEINGVFAETAKPNRFVGFVLMHEYEALLFSDPPAFAQGVGQAHVEPGMAAIRAAFATPEHINDHPETAPSKRLLNLIPSYDKPIYGTVGALAIGLEKMAQECPHFRGWLERLETFA